MGGGRGQQCPLVASPRRGWAPEAPGHTWENWAKVRSASMGTCPSSSWQQSLCWGRRVGGAGAPRAGSCPPNPRLALPSPSAGPGAGAGHSRLGGVHGRGGVADVLGALEHSEGQAGQEVPRGQQACHGPQLEAGPLCWGGGGRSGPGGWGGAEGVARRAARPWGPGGHRTLQEAGDVLQLRDSVLAVPAEALQQLEGLQVLAAGMGGVQAPQRGVDLLPAGQGLRPAPAAHPPCAQQRPHPEGSALPPAGPGSLTLQASLWPMKPATWCGFEGFGGELWGGPGKSLLHSDLVCLPGGHCLPRGFVGLPRNPCPHPAPSLPRGLTRWRSPRPCTPRGEWGRLWGGVCSQSRPLRGGRVGGGREGPRLSARRLCG